MNIAHGALRLILSAALACCMGDAQSAAGADNVPAGHARDKDELPVAELTAAIHDHLDAAANEASYSIAMQCIARSLQTEYGKDVGVEALLKLLDSADSQVVHSALEVLIHCEIPVPGETLDSVFKLTRAPETSVRCQVIRLLAKNPQHQAIAIPKLSALLERSSDEDAISIISAISQLAADEERTFRLLAKEAANVDQSIRRRRQAAALIERSRWPVAESMDEMLKLREDEALREIVEWVMLNHCADDARVVAIFQRRLESRDYLAILEVRPSEKSREIYEEIFSELLGSEVDTVRLLAAGAICKLNPTHPKARAELLETMLQSPSPMASALAARTILKLGIQPESGQAQQVCDQLLHHKSEALAQVLQRMGVAAAAVVPELAKHLNSPQSSMRFAVAEALVSIDQERSGQSEAIVFLNNEKNYHDQGLLQTVKRLSQHYDAEEIPSKMLLNLLGKQAISETTALLGLAQVPPETSSIPLPVVKTLQHESPVIRQLAIEVIRGMQEVDSESLQELEECLRDGNAFVRWQAAEVLRKERRIQIDRH